MRNRSPEKIYLGHLNIDSIRNKFDSLKYNAGKNISFSPI